MSVGVPFSDVEVSQLFDVGHARRGMLVVEGRVDSGEGLCTEDLFLIERPVRLSELSVPLWWEFSQLEIAWHGCSRVRFRGAYNVVSEDS